MAAYVEEKIHKYNEESLRTIGFTDVELETRFNEIRVHEANISNFFADLIRAEFNTDIAVFNTGTIRADELLNPGPMSYQTIQKIFAIPD
jgi:2',3'-cyclic-nucleotide 2'-phosphodiesterase (5'-nucleotidase family)